METPRAISATLTPNTWIKPMLNWLAGFKVYSNPVVARMLLLGFSAGLPLLLVLGTLSAWLREAGINRSTIGHLSWVGLLYGFKWVWSPLVDRLPVPFLTRAFGQRRGWMLAAQAGILLGLLAMAVTNPKDHLSLMVYCTIVVAFFAATQDIALDALRIESSDDSLQGALSAAYQTGYRLGMIWAGAGVLWLAAWAQGDAKGYTSSAWTVAYEVMAASMLLGMVTVLFTKEPVQQGLLPPVHVFSSNTAIPKASLTPLMQLFMWVGDAIATPLMTFVNRFGLQQAIVILILIATYRISDVVMGIMANPFYIDMKFDKADIATVTKIYGIIMTLVGASLGGVLVLRLGVMRVMMVGAVLSALTNVLFAWLATLLDADPLFKYNALVGVISADNLASGIATAAFIAYMSSLTSRGYSATQYALFSSLMVVLPKALAGFSGDAVNFVGYPVFFCGTALLGVPVAVLVWLAHQDTKR
jgi:MFS transporter, PAT family, beta-lactamase induction signal transducer AmpG